MQKIMMAAAGVLAAFSMCGAQSVSAQGTQYKRDVPDSLAKEATVSEADATAAAQKRVPKGTVTAMELEREHGHLLYSYDFKTPGKTGIDEVNVDAKTGKVLHVAHESPATEKKEAAADAREAKAKVKAAASKP